MSMSGNVSEWYKRYLKTADEVFYFTIAIALISFVVAVWAVVSGINEAQRFAEHLNASSVTHNLAPSIRGIKFQLLIALALTIRVIGLWSRKTFGYITALIALMIAVLIFREAWTWSDQVMRGIIQEEERKQLMTGYPPGFMFGTSQGFVIVYGFVFFFSLANELSIALVATFRYFRRSKSRSA